MKFLFVVFAVFVVLYIVLNRTISSESKSDEGRKNRDRLKEYLDTDDINRVSAQSEIQEIKVAGPVVWVTLKGKVLFNKKRKL